MNVSQVPRETNIEGGWEWWEWGGGFTETDTAAL